MGDGGKEGGGCVDVFSKANRKGEVVTIVKRRREGILPPFLWKKRKLLTSRGTVDRRVVGEKTGHVGMRSKRGKLPLQRREKWKPTESTLIGGMKRDELQQKRRKIGTVRLRSGK